MASHFGRRNLIYWRNLALSNRNNDSAGVSRGKSLSSLSERVSVLASLHMFYCVPYGNMKLPTTI